MKVASGHAFRGASLFSWCGGGPFLVSMNLDVLKNCSVNRD